MKLHGLLSGVLGLLMAGAATQAEKPTRDIEKMQGKWIIVSVEVNGTHMAKDKLREAPGALTLNGNHYTLTFGDITNTGTFKLDPKIKAVNVVPGDGPNKDKVFAGVYAIEGDRLKTCFDVNGGSRPTEFTTKDRPGWVLIEQKRGRASEGK